MYFMQQVKDIIDFITDFLQTNIDDIDKYDSEIQEKRQQFLKRRMCMIKRKIELLTKELNNAANAYYNSGNTIMSDLEYDQKMNMLKNQKNKLHIDQTIAQPQKLDIKCQTQ